MLAAGITDQGRVRAQNQDAVFCSPVPVGPLPNLFIVADGMGGHNAGDVASSKAVEFFCGHVRGFDDGQVFTGGFLDLLVDAAVCANQRVYEMSLSEDYLSGMGTTFSACLLTDGRCEILHIGDSRVYMVTRDGIRQLTADHSYVGEMVRAGQLTPEQAIKHPKRNILTRVLGVSPYLEFDGYPCALEDGCAILLCSDGLTNMLTDDMIFHIVRRNVPVDERAQSLIKEANAKGGADNISAVLIDTKDNL